MTVTARQRVGLYAALAAIGFVATWSYNIAYLLGGGSLAPAPFLAAVTANPLTTAITIDVYLAALVFSVWAYANRARPYAPSPLPYVVMCFVIGLAVAFPLYLAVWARREDEATR